MLKTAKYYKIFRKSDFRHHFCKISKKKSDDVISFDELFIFIYFIW